MREGWTVIKRAFDIAVSALGLTLVAPMFVVVAALIRCTSRGPVFFRQERIGRGFRPFYILKFRTMVPDAPKLGGVLTCGDDPRITRIGRFLRMTKLDELPQLINVLRGDMSFVGPRPERPEFVGELTRQIPFYGLRHVIKPGVTGWAQIRYTYGASVEDAMQKLQYDLYYIKNMSLSLDLYVILETIKTVLVRRGS